MNDVLIVEDHPFVAEATRVLISRTYPGLQIDVCSTASDATAALANPERRWHRVLLDLDVPGAHGLSLAREIKSQGMAQIACVVTANDRTDFVSQIKQMGFLGYIIKATPVDEFSAALEKIFRGERAFPSATQGPAKEVPRLTRRQAEILNLVRVGCSSKEIAGRLKLSPGTVNNHVTAVMHELNVSSRSHAVAKAIEIGILGIAPDEIDYFQASSN